MSALLTAWLGAATPALVVTSSGTSALELSGYVEGFYSYNANRPPNGVTALRGFDNRHDTMTLSNVAIDVKGTAGPVWARVALQVGLTPNTYYLAEPSVPAEGGVGESSAASWRFIQQAFAGVRVDLGIPLDIEAGVFLSPIGPESLAIKDSWNWSRSTLFYGLPFYHTGLRVTAILDSRWKVMVMGCNGWNTVLDNNDSKSLSVQVAYAGGPLTAAALYFGGPERAKGAPEGPTWRSLFDAWAQFDVTESLSLLGHFDAGFEPGRLGTSSWIGGALSARLRILDPLFFAVRADLLSEQVGERGGASAATIFWPTTDAAGRATVGSGTGTLELRAFDHLSTRLEVRHDRSNVPFYSSADGAKKGQTTITLGAVAWF